jgi:hypothetical protein
MTDQHPETFNEERRLEYPSSASTYGTIGRERLRQGHHERDVIEDVALSDVFRLVIDVVILVRRACSFRHERLLLSFSSQSLPWPGGT